MEKENTEKTEDQLKTERRWYAVHTYSGYEDAVARYLEQRVASLEMNDRIFSIVVPKEKKTKIKNGKRTEIEEKIYPGYVLVDMILTDDSWYVVRNTPRVTGFVGSDTTTPLPLSQGEVDELMMKMRGGDDRMIVDLSTGDVVRIIDGPFKDHDAKITRVDDKTGIIKVSIAIFGRDTEMELDSLQVQKV